MVILLFAGVVLGTFFFLTAYHRSGESVEIHGERWVVERAITPALREKGLSSRDALPSWHGMLFSFPDRYPEPYAFWMRGMRFPLDIAWIREGKVVFVVRDIPADSPDVFRPSEDADTVLEVNAGELEGVSVGDPVHIP
jgi:uncharacterized membrane protein (UPF0127 family)